MPPLLSSDLAKAAYEQAQSEEFLAFCPGVIRASIPGVQGAEKRIVYILRSNADRLRHYVGITSNVRDRLEWHNHGPSGHTVADRPWSLVVAIEFPTEREAVRLERYLKSGSGRAFTKRHFAAVGAD